MYKLKISYTFEYYIQYQITHKNLILQGMTLYNYSTQMCIFLMHQFQLAVCVRRNITIADCGTKPYLSLRTSCYPIPYLHTLRP